MRCKEYSRNKNHLRISVVDSLYGQCLVTTHISRNQVHNNQIEFGRDFLLSTFCKLLSSFLIPQLLSQFHSQSHKLGSFNNSFGTSLPNNLSILLSIKPAAIRSINHDKVEASSE
ncbi:hypothetical protein Hanom_Chr03g00274201 [Helianthus anomalus]